MTRNKSIILALVLSVITVTTVIVLEESISVSDRMETESIPITSSNEPITSSMSSSTLWPHTTLEYPTQVQKGIPFDVVVDYTWVKFETDDDTGEIEINSSASTSNNPELHMKNSGIYVDFISDVQLLNEDEFTELNVEEPSFRFGYENIFKQLQLPLNYDESQEHQKILTFQIDDVYPDHNKIVINAASNSEIELFYYEDQPNVITITTEFRPDETLCSNVDCMAQKYNEDKITEEGGDVVYVKTPTGYQLINEFVQNTRHFASGVIPEPNFTFEMPSKINVGQTANITYSINWNDEDGDPLYQSLLDKGYFDDFVITPLLRFPDEIKVVSEEFDLRAALGTSHNTHMIGKYYGSSIPYDNTQIFEGTIKIKLLESMFYDHDDIHFSLGRASDVYRFQTVSTNDGIVIVTHSDPRSDGFKHHDGIEGRYLEMYYFDREEQQWNNSDGPILDVTPNGFPQKVFSQQSPPMDIPREPNYMPREGWADFAEWLRSSENTGNFAVNREFFLSENMSEEWIRDFSEVYPEFLIEDTDFRYFILPEAHAATNDFFVYGYYKVDGHEGYEKGGDNVTICAYDANSDGYDETILQNGSTDVCKMIAASSGYFSLSGINSDSENSLMDLKFGINMKNNDVEIKGTNNIDDSIEPKTFFENAENTRYNISTRLLYVGDIEPHDYHTLPYYYLDLVTQSHTDLESKVNYDTPKVDIVVSPTIFANIEYFHGGVDHDFIENTIIYYPLSEVIPENFQYSAVLAHEYGHHVHHTYYKDNNNSEIPPCNVDNHGFGDFLTEECGWVEGFAWFFAAWLLNDSTLTIPTIIHTPKIIDLENTTIDGTPFTEPTSSNGITNEGWVAAALWDIYDDSSESGDDVNNEISNLWTTFTDAKERGETYPASSILEFNNDWNDNGYSSLDNVFSLNNLISTTTTTPPVTPPTNSIIFSDDFEGTLSKWTLTGDDETWETRQGIQTGTTGYVASSDDCDKKCYMVSDTIDTSQATTLTFDRYVSTSIDRNEGLKVEASTNNGRTWSELEFYTTTPKSDDSTWHSEELDISQYQSNTFKLKFTGISSSRSEIVQIDNVIITGSSGGGVTQPISSSFEDNFDNLFNWSKSGYDRWSIVSSWNEDLPEGETSFIAANNCDSKCILTSETIDLSSYSSATLEVSRFVDRSLDRGEYLSIEVYNGSWTEIAKWGADNSQDTDVWESESIDISRYLDDDFKIKITSLQSSGSEDTGIDYIRIN